LERGEQGSAQAIPPTLQQSLMARLDRLGPAREVAQIGSVIGRGFSYKLLKAVAGMDDAPLEAALEKLSDADIVLVVGVLPESDYRFKHALIQDAAYENLLKRRRQSRHRRIAEILRDRFADKGAAEPEVLAHHFTQAGLTDAAIEWWGKAQGISGVACRGDASAEPQCYRRRPPRHGRDDALWRIVPRRPSVNSMRRFRCSVRQTTQSWRDASTAPLGPPRTFRGQWPRG
jgi:hypothetical protein